MELVKNCSGVSFGWGFPGIEVVVILMEIAIIVYCWRKKEWLLVPMIIGGALNIWQRWQMGCVIDYWKIPVIGIYNNINDWLIAISLLLLVIKLWRQKK